MSTEPPLANKLDKPAQLVPTPRVIPSVEVAEAAQAIDPDALLMVRVKDGDQAAFDHLFAKHRRAIVNFARRYLGSQARAEDAAQEAFLRLYRARADYEPKTKFTTYLYRITTNTCLNHLRKKDWAGKEEPNDQAPDNSPSGPEQVLQGVELQRLIEKVMSELPEQQRTAFVLLRSEELAYEQIADIMGTTVPAVKSLLNRAKTHLMQRLEPYVANSSVPYRAAARSDK